MEEKEKVEFLFKMIDRYDNLRGTISNRAAIILSTNAIFLATETFIIEKSVSISQNDLWLKILLFFGVIITITLLLISIIRATSVIANVNRRTRSIFKDDSPQRLFFHAKETIKNFSSYGEYKSGVEALSTSGILDAGASELWALQRMYVRRYRNLSKAIKSLFWAVIFFIFTLALLLLAFFLIV